MKSLDLKIIALLPMVVVLLGLSGCNTVEGFGKDLKKVGDKIEKKADEVLDSDDSGGSSDY